MVFPYGVSVKDWFCSLMIDFPGEDIQIPNDNNDWKKPGDFLGNSLFFSSKGVPSTLKYDEFQEWALDVFYALN